MKSSGIGGQAVIEGIMMRNKEKYSIAVRKPDHEVEVVVRDSKLLTEKYKWLNYPIIRGVFNFFDSMVTGISTITYSASFYDDPAEQEKTKADEIGKAIFKDKLEAVLMAATILLSVAFAVVLFMLVPYYASRIFSKYIVSGFVLNFIEGIIRVALFVLYIFAISRMEDIRRTFMYHGAEHKCINCIESGAKLNLVNVKNSSRLHKRCGTSFLFFVMFVSIIFFIFIRVDSTVLQVVIRLLLIPVIAGVSYELIRWAGKTDNELVNVISKPGMWLQKLTTSEPDDDMIEVAIQAVESVFDWKSFLVEFYEDSTDPEAEMEAKAAELALSSNLIIDTNKNSRSINTNDITEEMKTEYKRNLEKKDSEEYEEKPLQESFEMLDEESDDSESTINDNRYEDTNTDTTSNTSETTDSDLYERMYEEEDDELPEGFEILEDVTDDAVSVDTHQTDSIQEEFLSDEEDDDGFEFVEEDQEDSTSADDVPVFKQRVTDKKKK